MSSSKSSNKKSSEEAGGRGPGRPPKPPEERRTISHGLRLSPKEKDELERRADEANVSINELLRRSTLGGEPLQSDVEKKTIRELSAIGNNLNQLTKAVHEGKLGGVEGLEETLKAIREKVSEL